MRMKKISLLLAVGFFLSQIMSPVGESSHKPRALTGSQSRSISTNLGLYGGFPTDFAIDPTSSNYVYLTIENPNGFFRSADGGSTWEGPAAGSNLGEGQQVEVNPSNGDVFVIIGDILYKSTNHGATLTSLSEGGFSRALIVRGDTILAGSMNGQVKVSNDGGSSWSNAAVDVSNSQITSFAASSTGVFYAVSEYNSQSDRLFKSVDDGKTWIDMDVHNQGVAPGGRFYRVAVNPNDPNDIAISSITGSDSYRTNNGGNTWIAQSGINGGAIVYSDNRLYIDSKYSEGGGSWQQIPNNITPKTNIYFDWLAIDPGNDKIMYANSGLGVAKTTDGGNSWTDNIDGIYAMTTFDISQADNKNVVWVATRAGLAKSTNFTSSSPTWEYPIRPGQLDDLHVVWVKPDNPDIVVTGRDSQIWRSVDGGNNWIKIFDQYNGSITNFAQGTDDNTIYASFSTNVLQGANTGGVLKSTNAGQTWTDFNLPSGAPAQAITVAKNGDVFVGVGSSRNNGAADRGIYKFSGGSWSHLSFLNDQIIACIRADTEDPNIIFTSSQFTGSSGGLYKSKDSGDTWEKLSNGIPPGGTLRAIAIQTTSGPNTIYVSGEVSNRNGAIYKSSDGGDSWGILYEGLKNENFWDLTFDSLVGGNDLGVYSYKSKARLTVTTNKRLVRKGRAVRLKVAMVDAATRKTLRSRKVDVWRLVGSKWRRLARRQISKSGYFNILFKPGRTTKYKATWNPGRADAREYVSATSNLVAIKVKK